jgi:hypothetical protein
LIQQRLTKISQEFSRGDFSNPANIHGQNMPGLAALRTAKPGQLHVQYKDLPNGAEITYSAEDKALINAVHEWFDAQPITAPMPCLGWITVICTPCMTFTSNRFTESKHIGDYFQ